jgi:predicted TIM-barrel fold metal-dependent hydrolase
MPADFIPFANDFPSVTLIISHLGCGWDNDPSYQVQSIQQSKHGNIYTDTSSAMSINPLLVDWAVKEIGAEKIMYGTDTPLFFTHAAGTGKLCRD